MTETTAAPIDAPRQVWLSALTLRRFRSHAAFERAFDARPVAIYGPNGAGKTNILEAISLLSPGRGLRGAKTEEMAARPDPIGWRIEAIITAADQEHRVAVAADLRAGARRRVEIDEAERPQTALGALVRMLWLTPAMDRLWIEGAAERRRFLDRVTLAFDPEHGPRSARYDRALRERNRLLKEPNPAASWLDALEASLSETGVAIAAARLRATERLIAAYEGAKTLFPKAEIAISGMVEEALAHGADAEAQERLARTLRDERGRDAAAGRTGAGPHRSDLTAVYAAKGMEARACSTGEQKALLISLTLATARALSTDVGAPPLLLLDEVAAHLDAGRRAALFDEICALGAQAWMTGTGQDLFEEFGDRAQMLALI